jgi:hypothetical protein
MRAILPLTLLLVEKLSEPLLAVLKPLCLDDVTKPVISLSLVLLNDLV